MIESKRNIQTIEVEMRQPIFALSLLTAFIFSFTTLADEGVGKLSLTEGIVLDKSKKEQPMEQESFFSDISKENQPTMENQEEQKEEKKGFFSFLNFSFFDKDEVKPVEPKEDETPEDFMARVNRLAGEGDVNALMTLGYMYLYGLNGVEMNYKKAFEYYTLAAEQGDSVAINNLGSMYYGGVGVRKNIEKAAELFAEASDLGNVEASLNLAVIYLKDTGKLHNEQEAVRLLKKTAEHDNPTGRYLLGYAYLKGIGVPQNKKKAVEHIRFAAEQGYDEAQYLLGYLYEQGWGVPQNYNNSLKFLNLAKNQGNLSAITMLGHFYSSGTRIEPDFYKAYIMYNIAAFYGVPKADERRNLLASKNLKKPEVLQAQAESENFEPKPSKLTKYIRSTFGDSLSYYIDPKAPIVHPEKDGN